MQRNRFWIGVLFCTFMIGVPFLQASPQQNNPVVPAVNLKGTWSGTFLSQHENVDPFTITVVIDQDSKGNLIASTQLSSDCVRVTKLQVTVKGTKVTLAGSDQDGANITLLGTVDSSGAMLDLRYIVNGSSSGRCESDNGTGNMGRR
jgi:hypothetical protein